MPYAKVKITKYFISSLANNIIPKNLIEAQYDPKWVEAVQEEIEALTINHIWDVVTIPEGAHVECK